MTHFEQMEVQGQTSIFDFLDITPQSSRNRGFIEGDKVKIRFYTDEIEFIQSCHPQLMEIGEIIGRHYDFYVMQIGEITLYIEGEKLRLV